MFAWMKQNPTLAAGIGLPLILVILFSIASAVPAMFVEAPKHDLLFYTHNYSNRIGADVTLSVVNGRLKSQYKQRADQYSNNTQNLYRYYAKTGQVKQITALPPDSGTDHLQEFTIPEVSDLKLDTNLTAPDGYTFKPYRSNSGGDIGSLFFGGSYRMNGPLISKDGRSIPLNPASNDYYGYNAQFLGWVKE